MYKYILKRLLIIIPILFCVSLIVFTILDLTPTDPARMILGETAPAAAVEELREEMGLNDPFFVRYFRYINDALHGDFGQSYQTGLDVVDEIAYRFPTTVKLAVLGIVVAIAIGIPIGIISAVKQYSALDMISTVTAMLLAAVPSFWLGLMLILFFCGIVNVLPSNGLSTWKHYILPTVTISAPVIGSQIRMTRSTMLESIRQDYVRTARSKGADERTVIWKHALRNALLPVITSVGSALSIMLGGTMIVESVFAIPGLGSFLVTAIRAKDVPQILASTLFLSFISCVVMLLVDLAYAVVDPRIRARYEK